MVLDSGFKGRLWRLRDVATACNSTESALGGEMTFGAKGSTVCAFQRGGARRSAHCPVIRESVYRRVTDGTRGRKPDPAVERSRECPVASPSS